MENLQTADTDKTSDSQQNEQTTETNTETDTGNNTYVNALSDSTVAIGASLQNMQQILLGNMQQVAQMTLSMNTMMEEMVRRAISIGVFAKASAPQAPEAEESVGSLYSSVLRISVTNNSPIPLVNLKASLHFAQRNSNSDAAQSKQSVRIASSPVCMPASSEQETSANVKINPVIEFEPLETTTLLPVDAGAQDEGGSSAVQQESKPTNIGTGATAESAVCISVDALKQLDGQITVIFISPGTGTPLSVNHRFGVHLMHLIGGTNQRYFCAAKDVARKLEDHSIKVPPLMDSPGPSITIDLAYLRNAFSVPPVDGIDVGSVFVLLSDHNSIMLGLRVSSIDAGSQHAECEWIGDRDGAAAVGEPLSDQAASDVIRLLSQEISSHIC
ncbi:hypothetical protein EV178_004669 [Coemansia sp. RSA 1646]|nr:hypothetical protein EV178_004669 [Coemansia sp. RSA 1646]